MKELKKHSLSLNGDYNLVYFEGAWLEGCEEDIESLFNPFLCITVDNFEYLWEEFLDCNLVDGVDLSSTLSDFLFDSVFGSTDISLASSVARQIRNTVIDMLPCEMTVEDFSCIIDSVVNKYKE